MKEELKIEFFEAFNKLKEQVANGEISESELFKLSGEFRNATGGRLSQYNSPLAVGVAVIKTKKDGKIGFLGCRRAIAPFIGGVAFPGGFVNEGEGTLEAAIRELAEETGVKAVWADMFKHVGEKKTPNNQLLTFYAYGEVIPWERLQKAFDDMNDKSETQELVFIEEGTEMCFSLHKEIHLQELEKWKNMISHTPIM